MNLEQIRRQQKMCVEWMSDLFERARRENRNREWMFLINYLKRARQVL